MGFVMILRINSDNFIKKTSNIFVVMETRYLRFKILIGKPEMKRPL